MRNVDLIFLILNVRLCGNLKKRFLCSDAHVPLRCKNFRMRKRIIFLNHGRLRDNSCGELDVIRKSHYVCCILGSNIVGKIHFLKRCFPPDMMEVLHRKIMAEKKFWSSDLDKKRGLQEHHFRKSMFRAGRRNMQGNIFSIQ